MTKLFSVALVLALSVGTPIGAGEPACPHLDGHWGWGGTYTVGSSGDLAVFNSGASLVVADWTVPSEPRFLGRARTDGEPADIVIEGTAAYVAIPEIGLQIFDLSSPSNPVLRGTWRSMHITQAVSVVVGHAFVADLGGGLRVIDVSDLDRPIEVAALEMGSQVGAHDVEVYGHHAMVAVGAGMAVVDVEAPTRPVEVARIGIDGFAPRLTVDGSVVWLLGGAPDLIGIDVSDPLEPTLTGGVELPGLFRGLDAENGLLYVAATAEGLYVVDISIPAQPTVTESLHLSGWAQGVSATDGGVLVATGDAGMEAVGVDGETEPTIEGGWIRPAPAAEAWDVAVAGERLFVADHSYEDGRLWVLDASDPRCPVELGWAALPSDAVALDLLPGMAVVAHATLFFDIEVNGGCTVVDLSDPVNPEVLGTISVNGGVTDVAAELDAAYLVNDGELVVIDLSRPNTPTEIARFSPDLEYFLSIAVVDRIAYAVGDHGSICVADVSVPAAPELLGCSVVADPTSNLVSVDVHGSLAAAVARSGSGGQNRLILLDVGDPVNPAVLSNVPATGVGGTFSAARVAIAGDLAAVSLGLDNGVQIFDIRDPADPRPIGERASPAHVSLGVAAVGDRLFVASGRGGVDSYRMGSCLQPRRPASRRVPGFQP